MPLTHWRTVEEVASFLAAHPDVPCFEVLVVEHRPASNLLAERLGVPHESPQAIAVRDGHTAWNDSHLRVSVESLAEAWDHA